MNKKELLKSILNAKTDMEKLSILRNECKGMKLYRYRRYIRDNQDYEIESTKNCNIWASRPDKFDDDYEGTIVKTRKKDVKCVFECVELINKDEAEREIKDGFSGVLIKKNQGHEKIENLLKYFQNPKFFNRENRRRAFKKVDNKCLDELLREYRNNYAVTCFSENEPINNKSMWQQYALNKDGTIAGFCLEYDIEDLIDSGYVLCPIFYKDNTTITDLCTEFSHHLESVFLHKDTHGYNKYKDPEKKILISWENQNEWRIIRDNRKQEDGLYLTKPVMPKKLYYLKDSPYIDDILAVFSGEKQEVDIGIV